MQLGISLRAVANNFCFSAGVGQYRYSLHSLKMAWITLFVILSIGPPSPIPKRAAVFPTDAAFEPNLNNVKANWSQLDCYRVLTVWSTDENWIGRYLRQYKLELIPSDSNHHFEPIIADVRQHHRSPFRWFHNFQAWHRIPKCGYSAYVLNELVEYIFFFFFI